jgi:hypothetical protein
MKIVAKVVLWDIQECNCKQPICIPGHETRRKHFSQRVRVSTWLHTSVVEAIAQAIDIGGTVIPLSLQTGLPLVPIIFDAQIQKL